MKLKGKLCIWRAEKACKLALTGQVDLHQLAEELFTAGAAIQSLLAETEGFSLLNRPDGRGTVKVPKQRDTVEVETATSQLVIDWANAKGILLDKKIYYYPVPAWVGYFNGLPEKRGIAKITNGIDLWIELPNGEGFKGHLDWFRKEVQTKPRKASRKKLMNIAGLTAAEMQDRLLQLLEIDEAEV